MVLSVESEIEQNKLIDNILSLKCPSIFQLVIDKGLATPYDIGDKLKNVIKMITNNELLRLQKISKYSKSAFIIYANKYIIPKLYELAEKEVHIELEEENSISTDEVNKDIYIAVQNKKIKDLRNKNLLLKQQIKYQNRPTKEELIDIADKYRYKSSKRINYSKLGKYYGRSYKTVQRWCKQIGYQ